MTIKDFVAYVKQAWYNKPNTSTPVEASRLLHIENGIKGNSDAIEKIAAAVVSQIVNDPDKIASMAALFSVNQKIAQQGEQITKLNSDFTTLKNDTPYLPFIISTNPITDALDITNKNGIYGIGPNTKNIPTSNYGQLTITKYADNNWIFVQFVPTSLSGIFYNFYNGYGSDSKGWSGWYKVDLNKM